MLLVAALNILTFAFNLKSLQLISVSSSQSIHESWDLSTPVTLFQTICAIIRRRQWHPTPVLLPGKSHGWRSLEGCMQSMGSLRVGHDWATSLSLFSFMHWRRKGHPTAVFLPGESQGRGSLLGGRLWGHRVRHDWSDSAAVLLLFCMLDLPHCL